MPISQVARNRVIREIPAIPTFMVKTNSEHKRITEVAYCRVSTEDSSQEDSYENQINHYTNKIKSDSTVDFGGIYADYGLSGTHSDTRPEFQRMMQDAREGKIHRIRCKAIQRFGRNTVDTLNAVRELRELGVSILFEQQGIDTQDAAGDIMITIMAAISEQESRNISENVKFGYREKFRQGGVQINWARFLGYRRNEETKELEIIEEEAEIVRRIYREFLSGYSTYSIANGLIRDNIKTVEWKRPSPKMLEKLKKKEQEWRSMSAEERIKKPLYNWCTRTIINILTNEKYCGDCISGKTFKVDVISKKRIKNEGQSPKWDNQNTHDAIITRETFEMVQEEMSRRNSLRGATNTGKAKHSSKYAFSKMIVCGYDGQYWRRWAVYGRDRTSIPVWLCQQKKVPKDAAYKCPQSLIKEQSFIDAYMEIMRELDLGDEFMETLTENIVSMVDVNAPTKLARIDEEMDEISLKILALTKAGGSIEQKTKDLAILIEKQEVLKQQKIELQEQIAGASLSKYRIEQLKQSIKDIHLTTEFDESMFRSTIDKIIIKDKQAKFIFKCGVEIEKKVQ